MHVLCAGAQGLAMRQGLAHFLVAKGLGLRQPHRGLTFRGGVVQVENDDAHGGGGVAGKGLALAVLQTR